VQGSFSVQGSGFRVQGSAFENPERTPNPSLSGILCVGHNMRSVDAPKTEIVHL
jgi:hypothetical protein